MAISPQFLDELKARVGLADIIARKVKLTKKGREHSGLCPFHNEKTPSFTVNEEKGFYHCFGCGAHGSAIDFLMNTEGLSFPEAVERLAGEAGMQVPRDTPEERQRAERRKPLVDVTELAANWFEKMLRMPEGKAGLDYFSRRGLSDETITRFRLGFAPDARGALKAALAREGVSEDLKVEAGLLIRPDDPARQPYDRFRGRVMFPITDKRGQVIAFGGRIIGNGEPKYLNSPETPLFHKGSTLYGLDQALPAARKEGKLIVTEGYMDVIALHVAGFTTAVAPLGTALTENQIRTLWRIAPEPVLCFDGDAAGQRAAARAAERVLPLLTPGFGLRFAVLPEGEDPDSLIATKGSDAMAQVLAGAAALSDVLWQMESHGRVPSAPEERATLQKRLDDHAARIEDPTVRSHFRRGFRDRLWQGTRRGGAQPSHGLGARAGAAARVEGRLQAERVLLAIALRHPEALHYGHAEEDLGALSLGETSMDALRQEVLAVLAEGYGAEAETVEREVRARGFGETVDALFSDPLIRRHRHIRADADSESVRETWTENIDAIRRDSFAAELAQESADGDTSVEDVMRFLKKKQAEHDDR